MGIKPCCVKQEPEEERNLQKTAQKIECDQRENKKIENGAYITEKTTDKLDVLNTHIFTNKDTKQL